MRPLEGAERRFAARPASRATGPAGWSLRLPKLRLRIESAAAPAAPAQRRDPAPSRLGYKLHRLWLTPGFRRLVRLGLPSALAMTVATVWVADPAHRAWMAASYHSVKTDLQNRPEFMISLVRIDGASAPVDRAIRDLMPADLPVSSFRLDLPALHAAIAALDAVDTVDLRVRGGGILAVSVTERVPAAIWQSPAGLQLLDATGHRVATLLDRAARPDLPLLAGEGAEAQVAEALAILEAARPVMMRVRGLVRMGERRWDLVLDRGLRILLPETGAVGAMQRLVALDKAEDLLARDITVVDLRSDQRPVIRLNSSAMAALAAARPGQATRTAEP